MPGNGEQKYSTTTSSGTANSSTAIDSPSTTNTPIGSKPQIDQLQDQESPTALQSINVDSTRSESEYRTEFGVHTPQHLSDSTEHISINSNVDLSSDSNSFCNDSKGDDDFEDIPISDVSESEVLLPRPLHTREEIWEGFETVPKAASNGEFREGSVQKSTCSMVFEILLTYVIILLTFGVCGMLAYDCALELKVRIEKSEYFLVTEQCIFIIIAIFLVCGNLVYQCSRLGALKRHLQHRPPKWKQLGSMFDGHEPSLVTLVPSYKEEYKTIEQTLLSSALQGYSRRSAVLLIDDAPVPKDAIDAKLLADAIKCPTDISDLIDPENAKYQLQLSNFEARLNLASRNNREIDYYAETLNLAQLYNSVVHWYDVQVMNYGVSSHTDAHFVKKVFIEPMELYQRREYALRTRLSQNQLDASTIDDLMKDYRRLAGLYDCKLSAFIRKKYVNLSQEANKAMNLNTYIALMGGDYNEIQRANGLQLVSAKPENASIHMPTAEYICTLDADSILSHNYALLLIYIMTRPGNERMAVAQTPYSSFPHPPGILERIVGSTTDVQFIVHQGFTYFNSTFWVGANAVQRKCALEDVHTTEIERGYEVKKYVQDRTVIEDTESTIDLIAKGWSLYNHPARLAYSATPPDFGALVIQRRRWANGGLIIFPKLVRYLCSRPCLCIGHISEALERSTYLVSIMGVNLGYLILMCWAFEDNMSVYWLAMTAVPYLYLYGRDLSQLGYGWGDLPRLYALNLILIPINLGGVLKSIQQGLTGAKIPFTRTPKVNGRTAAPPIYVIMVWLLTGTCIMLSIWNSLGGRWIHGLFATFNGICFLYAGFVFIGIRESAEDLALQLCSWKPASHTAKQPTKEKPDFVSEQYARNDIVV